MELDAMATISTLHVHGTAGAPTAARLRTTRGLGPAESFPWLEGGAPGTCSLHCHVETHMAQG